MQVQVGALELKHCVQPPYLWSTLLQSTVHQVWCRIAHTRLINSVLNKALRIVTGCLRPTPTDYLPVLAGIQPAELRRLGATLSLAYRGSLDPDHILYELLAGSPDGHRERLKSRRPFVLAARKLLQDLTELDIRVAQWTDFKWSTEYLECSSDLRAFIPRASTRPMGMGLPRSSWVRLNRLRAGVGCLQSFMHNWGLELRVWRCRTNRRTHYSDMPRTSGTHRNTSTDGFGC